jgi:hypothetical protein
LDGKPRTKFNSHTIMNQDIIRKDARKLVCSLSAVAKSMQNKVDRMVDCRPIARLRGPFIYAAGSKCSARRS